MKKLVLPMSIVIIGLGSLLSALDLLPRLAWLWVAVLALAGVVTLIVDRLAKFNLTIGLFLIYSALMSLLRQSGVIGLRIEVPLLVIGFGSIWLLVSLALQESEEGRVSGSEAG